MREKYFIIGSGGFAKEVYFLAKECLGYESDFGGFIDFEPTKLLMTIGSEKFPILDEKSFLEKETNFNSIQLYIGIGDPKILQKLQIKFANYFFPNLIHPSFVGDKDSIHFGNGNIITAGCIFTVDIQIGSFNIFNLNTTIGHDSVIGDCNVFNPAANISGGVNIGSGNLLGTNCTVLQNIQIGDENIIGAMTLANKDISSNNTMVGVPARKMEK